MTAPVDGRNDSRADGPTGGPTDGQRDAPANTGAHVLRIGTRGSQLALWQAHTVAARLQQAHPDLTCDIVVIKTSGDRLADAPLSEAGGKRLFVREIEEALSDGRIDVAVHSAKDMPAIAESDLIIGAVLTREEPWDAIVLPSSSPHAASLSAAALSVTSLPAASISGASSRPPLSGASLPPQAAADIELLRAHLRPNAVVGTSSVRRTAQLRQVFPGATFAPIRGNLDTRLRKLDEGQYDLLVLAAAGLKRLGAEDRISTRLGAELCLPAPGQGAIAVEVRRSDEAARMRVAAIDDPVTARALAAERAVVVALGGGCQMPLGALAQPAGEDGLVLHALVSTLDGLRVLRASSSGPAHDADAIGRRAADELRAQGADQLLAGIMPS